MIEDTSRRDPIVHLGGALAEGTENYILGMEAAGQRQMVASELIPLDRRGEDSDWEALGFVFGEKDDDLFQQVVLPEGWAREGSGHSMWSYIVDDEGFRRIAIFYKAAFYDRSAHASIVFTPATRAQEDAYWDHDYHIWRSGEVYREDDLLVRTYKGQGDAHFGKELTLKYAKDGSLVARFMTEYGEAVDPDASGMEIPSV